MQLIIIVKQNLRKLHMKENLTLRASSWSLLFLLVCVITLVHTLQGHIREEGRGCVELNLQRKVCAQEPGWPEALLSDTWGEDTLLPHISSIITDGMRPPEWNYPIKENMFSLCQNGNIDSSQQLSLVPSNQPGFNPVVGLANNHFIHVVSLHHPHSTREGEALHTLLLLFDIWMKWG